MTFLTSEQREFVKSLGLSEEDVLDGRGMSKKGREARAREQGKQIILTGVACAKAGHFLKTRSGHCVECNTSSIAYQKRHRTEQTIYITGSKSESLLKVGVTKDPFDRHKQMNEQGYGDIFDWDFLFQVIIPDAGRIEGEVLKRLSNYQIERTYWKDGKEQTAKELIKAPLKVVYQTLAEIISSEKLRFDTATAKKSGDWHFFGG